ncbi:MAG: hypothetical protein WCT03_16075 [Candidatus Obscuribacterales bacterium]
MELLGQAVEFMEEANIQLSKQREVNEQLESIVTVEVLEPGKPDAPSTVDKGELKPSRAGIILAKLDEMELAEKAKLYQKLSRSLSREQKLLLKALNNHSMPLVSIDMFFEKVASVPGLVIAPFEVAWLAYLEKLSLVTHLGDIYIITALGADFVVHENASSQGQLEKKSTE